MEGKSQGPPLETVRVHVRVQLHLLFHSPLACRMIYIYTRTEVVRSVLLGNSPHRCSLLRHYPSLLS